MLVCHRVYLLKNVELHFQVLLFVLRSNEFSDNNDALGIRFEPPGAVPTDDCGAPPFWSIPFNFSGWSKSVGWFHWQDSTTAWHEQEWMKGMDTSKWRSWYEFQEIISLHEPIIPMAAAPLADLIKTLFPQLLALPENIWKQNTLNTHGLSSCSFLKIACYTWFCSIPPRNPRLSKPIAGRTPALGDMSLASPRPVPWAIWGYPKRSHVWYHMK